MHIRTTLMENVSQSTQYCCFFFVLKPVRTTRKIQHAADSRDQAVCRAHVSRVTGGLHPLAITPPALCVTPSSSACLPRSLLITHPAAEPPGHLITGGYLEQRRRWYASEQLAHFITTQSRLYTYRELPTVTTASQSMHGLASQAAVRSLRLQLNQAPLFSSRGCFKPAASKDAEVPSFKRRDSIRARVHIPAPLAAAFARAHLLKDCTGVFHRQP